MNSHYLYVAQGDWCQMGMVQRSALVGAGMGDEFCDIPDRRSVDRVKWLMASAHFHF